MTEHELVTYHEILSDLVSSMEELGTERIAEDLVGSFKAQAMDLGFKLLECARKKQVAALFLPPQEM